MAFWGQGTGPAILSESWGSNIMYKDFVRLYKSIVHGDHAMLEQLFSSRVRVKLLTIFLTNPDTSFYTRELERLLAESPYAIQRELRRLEAIGLLTAKPEGNIRYYTVNRRFLIYEELKSMVLKTSGVGDALRAGLAKLGSVQQAFIYGSVAAGDEHHSSDIDLMIVGRVDLMELASTVSQLEDSIGREISYVIYDRDELTQKLREGDPFLSNVQSGPKMMLIGREDDLPGTDETGED
jgi:predicted nucleotidyltransferase